MRLPPPPKQGHRERSLPLTTDPRSPQFTGPGVGGIIVPSINRLWSPVWRLSAWLESGTIYNILFNMQNPSKILLKLKLGNSKMLQITSYTPHKILLNLSITSMEF